MIESIGRLARRDGGRLEIAIDPAWVAEDPIQMGESIAVNGCCLTVVGFSSGSLAFDLSEETLARTALGRLEVGERVNLERALKASARLGGHIVQGHVDATGSIEQIDDREGSLVLRVQVPTAGAKYLIDKGSIAVDGISLTVVSPSSSSFELWIVPHTQAKTNLGDRRVGDPVNLEYDVLAKYTERLLGLGGQA